MELLSPEGLRVDGRRPKEVRKLDCQLNTVAKADGSATLQQGNTIVLASVFGPREISVGAKTDRCVVCCEAAVAPFSAGERRRRGRGDRLVVELAALVKGACEATILTELLPRTQIDVYVQVLQADGGVRSAVTNAAMLALADAGVPLRDLLSSVTVGWVDNTVLLDLNHVEESRGAPCLTLSLQPNLDKVVLLQQESRISVDVLESMMQLAADGCRAITHFLRDKLLEHVQQLAAARGRVAY